MEVAASNVGVTGIVALAARVGLGVLGIAVGTSPTGRMMFFAVFGIAAGQAQARESE